MIGDSGGSDGGGEDHGGAWCSCRDSIGKISALNPQISSAEKFPKIFGMIRDSDGGGEDHGGAGWCPCRGRATVTWGRS